MVVVSHLDADPLIGNGRFLLVVRIFHFDSTVLTGNGDFLLAVRHIDGSPGMLEMVLVDTELVVEVSESRHKFGRRSGAGFDEVV